MGYKKEGINVTQIRLIVGLANPGAEYAATRHNAGAWYVDALAEYYNQQLKQESKFFGYACRISIAGQDIRLLVPTTFMNLSGKSVAALASFYQISPEEILVAHDELDLAPGIARIKFGGGNGGHNGLKDITNKLGNNANYFRLRIGIGHPGDKSKVTGYVLGKPPINENNAIDDIINDAIQSTEILIKQDATAAMNKLHACKYTP